MGVFDHFNGRENDSALKKYNGKQSERFTLPHGSSYPAFPYSYIPEYSFTLQLIWTALMKFLFSHKTVQLYPGVLLGYILILRHEHMQ